MLLDRANASPRCGATCKRTGQPCRGAAMPNGRCRMHGGGSTGARTSEGQARCQAASWKHGGRDAAARARARQRRAAQRLVKELLSQLRQTQCLENRRTLTSEVITFHRHRYSILRRSMIARRFNKAFGRLPDIAQRCRRMRGGEGVVLVTAEFRIGLSFVPGYRPQFLVTIRCGTVRRI